MVEDEGASHQNICIIRAIIAPTSQSVMTQSTDIVFILLIILNFEIYLGLANSRLHHPRAASKHVRSDKRFLSGTTLTQRVAAGMTLWVTFDAIEGQRYASPDGAPRPLRLKSVLAGPSNIFPNPRRVKALPRVENFRNPAQPPRPHDRALHCVLAELMNKVDQELLHEIPFQWTLSVRYFIPVIWMRLIDRGPWR